MYEDRKPDGTFTVKRMDDEAAARLIKDYGEWRKVGPNSYVVYVPPENIRIRPQAESWWNVFNVPMGAEDGKPEEPSWSFHGSDPLQKMPVKSFQTGNNWIWVF
jgi:hypothetical protein